MDALEAQKALVQVLLRRLKASTLESISFHAVVDSFPEDLRTRIQERLEFYRRSEPIQQKVDEQFSNLDSIIEKVALGIQEQEFRKILERFEPTGEPN